MEKQTLWKDIEKILKYCESRKKTELETIEIMEIMFDYYRGWKQGQFFENDYYIKYCERLEEIRNISYGSEYTNSQEILFI